MFITVRSSIYYLLKYIQRGSDVMIRLTLAQYLDSHRISRYALHKRTGIQYQVIDNYYKNKVQRYDSDVLDRICAALSCDICDLLAYQPNKKP